MGITLILRAQLEATYNPQIFWEPETCLTAPPYGNSLEYAPEEPKVAVTSDGQVHIVWNSDRPNLRTPQVYYKRFVPGAGWTEDTCISADLAQLHMCAYPGIAADSQDNIHVVWREYPEGYHIWYKMRRADGVWDSLSTLLSVGSSTLPRGWAKVACTPDGNVHVVWMEWYPLYGNWIVYRQRIGDVWTPPVTVDSVDTTYFIQIMSLAAGRDNRVHLVYDYGRIGVKPLVCYRCRSGGLWGPREWVLPDADTFLREEPRIAVNPATNEPHICWLGRPAQAPPIPAVYHTYKCNNIWQPYDTVSPADSFYQSNVVLAFTRDGIGHLVWSRNIIYPRRSQTCHRERSISGEWLPASVRADTGFPNYQFATTGGNSENYAHLYVVRDNSVSGSAQIYFLHGLPGPQSIEWQNEQFGAGLTSNLLISGSGQIWYAVERSCQVELALYDVLGRKLRVLEQGERKPGRHSATIPDDISTGVYFVCQWTPDARDVKKVVLVR